jgi:hypothetical protein
MQSSGKHAMVMMVSNNEMISNVMQVMHVDDD